MFAQINNKYPQFHFRYLIPEDYHRGLFDVLSQLTKAPTPNEQQFKSFLNQMDLSAQYHANIVGIDKKTDRVVAFGTLLVCDGVWHRVGKIQNIVTCKSVRGKGLGRAIIELLKWIGWDEQCERISLFCEQKNVQFYNKLGFNQKGVIYAHYKA